MEGILPIILLVYILLFFGLLTCPKIGMLFWVIAYIGTMYVSYSVAIAYARYGSRMIDYAYIPGFFPAMGFFVCFIKNLINKSKPKKTTRTISINKS